MPEITTIRVVRRRSVQPEQFGNATAEVELTGNVLDGEDYKEVARQMLIDSRALVYENLGKKLPKHAVDDAKEKDTPEETAKVETKEADTETDSEPTKKRGRPKGSKNTAPKKGSTAAKAKEETAKKADSDDDIPDDEPNIRANPEDRKNPDDDIPGSEESGDPVDDLPDEGGSKDDSYTAKDLHDYVIKQIKAGSLTTMQAKQMQREMGIVRVKDLDTPEKVAKARTMIESFVKANEAKK